MKIVLRLSSNKIFGKIAVEILQKGDRTITHYAEICCNKTKIFTTDDKVHTHVIQANECTHKLKTRKNIYKKVDSKPLHAILLNITLNLGICTR